MLGLLISPHDIKSTIDDSYSLFAEGTIEEYESFVEKYSSFLHPTHYHMMSAKHSLMQMMGRTEECLIQDMDLERVRELRPRRLFVSQFSMF